MKLLGLDIGDVWTGIAISDALGITSRPLKTVKTKELISALDEILQTQTVSTIVVGYPQTLSGTESNQTKKVIAKKESLEKSFPNYQWVFEDERYTSQQAEEVRKSRTKEDKIRSHAIAAAFILKSHLDYLYLQKTKCNT